MEIDEELQLLQRQLMTVQQQKTNPLSQRTVAEIMIKLQQEGLKFYATTDGNQYLTPSRLDTQIIEYVTERGRIKIGILPQLLNLNQDLIQSRINRVCQISSHIRNNDNLLSKEYIANFVHSVKQRLELDGSVALDQLAISQEFNMPFLMKIINENLLVLDAQIQGGQLSTQEFKRMKKRRILGFLLAISKPINIQTLSKILQIDDYNPEIQIQELIEEGQLKGVCKNSFYVPARFSDNQKEMIEKFYESNGYIDIKALQKKYNIGRAEEWLKKNITKSYIIYEGICFNVNKIELYKIQIQNLIKTQGFFQISNVIQFQIEDKKLQKFFNQYCQIHDFIIDNGICYSEEWLVRCTNEFRDKVIYDIFFKKNENKSKKKPSKKEKQQTTTEEQLIQIIFDSGLAQYSIAQSISPSLLPIINERTQKLKDQLHKQLSQNQGVITSTFLKYRKCKTIIKSPENLQRVLNTIEKQKKKGNLWSDPDFGVTEMDPLGKYSLIYYDGILPKQWGELDNIQWREIPYTQLVSKSSTKSKYLYKSLVTNILQIVDHYNLSQKEDRQVQTPNFKKIQPASEGQPELSAPFAFKFHLGDQLCKYVLVDNRMPYIEQVSLGSKGINGLIEKAYAKLRYCYKGLLNVGIQQQIFQLVGLPSIKIIMSEKVQKTVLEELMEKYILKGNLVIGMGQGEVGKKIKVDGDETQYRSSKPYQISAVLQSQKQFLKIFPGESTIQLKLLGKLFKNIYIIQQTC